MNYGRFKWVLNERKEVLDMTSVKRITWTNQFMPNMNLGRKNVRRKGK